MMMYEACVPVLQHYLNQLDHMLLKTQRHLATKPEAELLQLRLAPDMMVLWQQVLVAVGFSLRASAPLVEVDAPTIQFEEKSIEFLRADLQVAQNFLGQLKPEQFINRGTSIYSIKPEMQYWICRPRFIYNTMRFLIFSFICPWSTPYCVNMAFRLANMISMAFINTLERIPHAKTPNCA